MIRINLLTVERERGKKRSAAGSGGASFGLAQKLTVACSLILVLTGLYIGWRYLSLTRESDRIDEDTGEERWHAIGAVSNEPYAAVVLLVVHVYREMKDDQETIRIISAREAGKNDARRYQE